MPLNDTACFRLDRIAVRPIRWLWRPYHACGKLAILDRDPCAGKSLLPADLAARLTRSGRMPGGSKRRPKANVLFLRSGGWAWSPGVCGRTARHSGSGRIRPCRTAPDDADEGKADRPPSRAVAALRPWPAGNPKR